MANHTIDILILASVDANELTELIHQTGSWEPGLQTKPFMCVRIQAFEYPKVYKSIIAALRILALLIRTIVLTCHLFLHKTGIRSGSAR